VTIEIALSNSNLVAKIDEQDYEHVAALNWHAMESSSKNTWYARSGRTFMHRFIMGLSGKEEADHRDHCGLNNTRENLRVCTHSQNGAYRHFESGVSGFRGVYWDAARSKWIARIKDGSRVLNLGRFDDPAEAALARDERAILIYGEFAMLNFPSCVLRDLDRTRDDGGMK
jgi:hypothetical protein